MPYMTWRRWNKCFQGSSFSIHTECLTVCVIVLWQENIKLKMLNITLATVFIVYISYTGEIAVIRIRRWIKSPF